MDDLPDVRLEDDALVLGPAQVRFMRTLRVPESGMSALPPGLGTFPLRRVADYPRTAPEAWLRRGGVMLPIYQREAMWLSFGSAEPVALQVGVGMVSAVSGTAWSDRLRTDPQDYVVLPEQPWLDGINAGDGWIRQFVAVPLGSGATVEGQVTGEEVHGGVQLRAVGLAPEALRAWEEGQRRRGALFQDAGLLGAVPMAAAVPDMGLGAGGRMRQEVYVDDRPVGDYDETRSWRVFVHLCSPLQWTQITGELPPPTPADRDAYTALGLPWFDYFDAEEEDLPAPEVLRRVRPVGEVTGEAELPWLPVDPGQVVGLKDRRPGDAVDDGAW